MHEFGVAASVVDAVEARADGRAVRAVRLRVGVLSRLDRTVFDEAFALVADGGVADGAHVEVVEVGVAVSCRTCGGASTGTELITSCAHCGGHDLELTAGDDLMLESITVVAPESANDEQEVG